MKIKMKKLLIILAIFSTTILTQSNKNIPYLKKHGDSFQLIIKGKPFLMLAGETGNSSASDLKYMNNNVWPNITKMHLNTLVVPVYWELIEPEEGAFDFTLVDSTIATSRQNNIKLVFLWFGTWKNSMSCYVPLWIKTDQKKFPRAREKDGKAEEILTAFNNTNRNTDAQAFATLMKHIRKADENEQTVVMVQVENEMGMIPFARDYCGEANKYFNSSVPEELINYLNGNKDKLNSHIYSLWEKNGLKTKGNWEEIFGSSVSTDEIFMAWYYAKYANYIAEAGKKEYPLPMYVNAALIRPGYKPGQYPSAGPLPHLFDIWKAAAPSIDFLSPDIYFPSFAEWSEKFYLPNNGHTNYSNPLFIPEVGNNQCLANAFFAFGQLNAMGFSPFSVESVQNPEKNQVEEGYDILTQLAPLILENQGKGTMAGVLLDSASQVAKVKLGGYIFNFHHSYSWPYAPRTEGENPRFGGLIIMISPDEFYIAGKGLIVTFETGTDDNSFVGIGSMDEGKFVDGKWFSGRRLNGDQSHQGRHMDLPVNTFSIQRVRLYKYK
jgi:beta-galactosidase GanA